MLLLRHVARMPGTLSCTAVSRSAVACVHQSACVRDVKLSVENLKAVRSKTGLSISLCRQALLANADSVPAALKWLDENEAARAEFVA